MTNDTRTSDEIEQDIEHERARMSDTINDLQKKFSVETIVSDIGSMFRNQGGDLGRAVSQTVGRNPAAVVMVGVGLAWLFLGQGRNRPMDADDDPWHDADRRGNRSTFDTWDRSLPHDRSTSEVNTARDELWYGNGRSAPMRPSLGDSYGQDRSQIKAAASGVMGKISGAASAVGEAVSGAASNVSNAASDLTERLSHGLEDFSEDARSRVVAARRAAHDARQASVAKMKQGARVASNFFEDQPLVVGALAVAVGAAMGGILPHSKVEDDMLGDSSDKLFADAQALFRDERDKAMAAVRMAASDVKDEMRSAGSELAGMLPEGKNVGEVIVDRAAGVANRVMDRAAGNVEYKGSDQSQG